MSVAGLTVVDGRHELAVEAARRFEAAAAEAIRTRGRFVVVLAGGSTPVGLYALLASPEHRQGVDWSRTIVLFGDERCVPPTHARSNFRMASETLLDHVAIPRESIHRMEGEATPPAEAAERYEETLRCLFPGDTRPGFDLLLLGMGADGHTASLFPGTAALAETARWVAANHVPKLDAWRITLTLPALIGGRRILFLVAGKDKAPVFAEAFGGLPHQAPHPCERVVPDTGVREILADREAASRLP